MIKEEKELIKLSKAMGDDSSEKSTPLTMLNKEQLEKRTVSFPSINNFNDRKESIVKGADFSENHLPLPCSILLILFLPLSFSFSLLLRCLFWQQFSILMCRLC